MGLVIRDQQKVWSIELTRFHGLNVVIYNIVTGSKQTPLVIEYLPPSTLDYLPDLEKSLTQFQDQDPIVLGDLKSNIGQAQNLRSLQIADLLIDFELVDLLHHFQQRWKLRQMKTWLQVRKCRLLREKCDYILGMDWR